MSKYEETRDLILSMYGGLVLSRKQVAMLLNKSISTIDRWKKKGIHLEYRKDDSSKNGSVEYTIDTVIDYILNHNVKVK